MGVRMTERDEQLLGTLARVRALSREQIGQLFFARVRKDVLDRRLRKLVRGSSRQRGLLRMRRVRQWEGFLDTYSLTAEGHRYAALLCEETFPPHKERTGRRGEEFVEHLVQTNQLYVDLVRDDDPIVQAAKAAAFRWVPTTQASSLVYRQRGAKGGNRIIAPDATVESTTHRIWVECERGGHPVERFTEEGDSIVRKLVRYGKYVGGLADPESGQTWYRAQFPDGRAPVVMFMVATDRRADGVREKLTGHIGRDPQNYPEVLVTSFAEAATQVRPLVLGRTSAAVVPNPDVGTMRRFVLEALGTIQKVRHAVRAGRRDGEEPEYPEGWGELYEWARAGRRSRP